MAPFLNMPRTAHRMKARLTERNPRALALATLCLLALAACSQKPKTERPPSVGDVAVARVNGATIWNSDVRREAVAEGLIARDEPLPPSSPLFARTLEEVVDQSLLAGESARRGLDKSPEAQRRLAAARQRVLADLLLEQSVSKSLHEDAVQGLYQEMVKNHDPSAPPLTLAAARPQIIRFLTYDEVKDLVLDLRRHATIETLLPPAVPAATPQPVKTNP